MPDGKEYKKGLYANLVSAYGKDKLPDEGTFYQRMDSDSNYRKGIYSNLEQVYGKDNMPSYDDFEIKAGVKKKNGGNVLPSVPQYTSKNYEVGAGFIQDESDDPISLAKKSKQLKGIKRQASLAEGLAGKQDIVGEVPDETALAQSKEIDDKLKAQGYDANKLADDFEGIPEYAYNTFSKEKLLKEYKENPYKYDRIIATIKGQHGFLENLKEQLKNKNIDQSDYDMSKTNFVNHYNQLGEDNPTSERIKNAQYIMNDVERFGGDKKDFLKRQLGVDFANIYGKLAGEEDFILSNAGGSLNNLQRAGYEYLKDIHPEQVKQYAAAFLKDDLIKDNFEAQLGKEEAQKKLMELGISLRKAYLKEKLSPMEKEYNSLADKNTKEGGLSPEDFERYKQIEAEGAPLAEQLQMVEEDENNVNKNFQKAAYFDANNFAQELLGQKNTGLERFMTKTGEAFANTGRGIYDFAATPFKSEQENQLRQYEILGQGTIDENISYLKQSNQLRQTFKPEISDELKGKIDAIKKDDNLSSTQKLTATTKLLMENGGQWARTPHYRTNIGIKSLLYGVSDLASTLAPFMLLETVTGGGATPALARKLTSSFVSAAATSFEETYRSALKRGEKNPYAYAMRVTAINSAAMAGAGTADKIKAMFKGQNTPIANLVKKMSTEEIEAAMKELPKSFKTFKSAIKTLKDAGIKSATTFGKSALESTKDAAKMTAIIEGGGIVNDAISGELKSPKEYAENFMLETLKFGIFGTATRTAKEAIKPTDINLTALHEVATNKDGFLLAIDKQLKDGDITPTEAADIKQNVETVAKIYQKNSPVFKTLDDKAQRDYLYNSVMKSKAEEMAKSLPEKQAEKYEMDAMVLDMKNGLIAEPKTPEQLEKRKTQLEKELEPKTDANGKKIEIPEKEKIALEAEKRAIEEVMAETKTSSVEKPLPKTEVSAKPTAEELLKPHEKNGMFMGMETPEQKLQFIAEQAQGVMADGSLHEAGGKRNAMDEKFGKELVDAAIEKFPYKEKEISLEEKRDAEMREATRPELDFTEFGEEYLDGMDSKSMVREGKRLVDINKRMESLKSLFTCIWG